MCMKYQIQQWKLANRHSRIGRNWSRIDSQAKTHVEADKCSFSVTEYAQECN